MKITSYNISKSIDLSLQNALVDLKRIADSLNIPIILVGATARDIIFEQIYHIKAPRRTMDIDIAIRLESWEQFYMISEQMVASGAFTKGRESQRFLHNQTIIDIIPFGSISSPDDLLKWPQAFDIVLNVMEYNQIFMTAHSVCIKQNPDINILMPSIPGLAILKILSWYHGYPERAKDAKDFYFIMTNYEFTEFADRLYSTESLFLQQTDYDRKAASIRLLGKDMAQVCDSKGYQVISDIFAKNIKENSSFDLVNQIMTPEKSFDIILSDLKHCKTGFLAGYQN